MIAASEPQEFIPFGRQQILEHPGAIQIGIQDQNKCHTECALSNRLSEVAISDCAKKPESWILREATNESTECEEELYCKGKTVVWSVGPASTENRSNRILKCCYTSETEIKEALWCNFHLSTPDITTSFLRSTGIVKSISLNTKINKVSDLKDCVCIMDSNNIKFYTKSGKEYMTTLQFQVLKIWAIKYGLIFVRQLEKKDNIDGLVDSKKKMVSVPSPQPFRMSFRNSSVDLRRQSIEQSFFQNQKNITDFSDKSTFGSTQYLNLPSNVHEDFSLMSTALSVSTSNEDDNSNDLPIIFSLSHPLDEICPVVAKHESLSYISNPDVRIIFTSESPSLCMIYDQKTKLHSLYFVRQAEPQESEICLHRESMLSRHSRSHHSFNTSGKPCFSNSANSSFNIQTGNISLPAFLNAKTRKSLGLTHNIFPNVVNSPFTPYERTRHSSPLSSKHIPPAFSHNFFTPSPRRNDSSLNSSFGTPNRIENRMMTEDIEYAEPKPLYPQICLQHLWTEASASDNSVVSAEASKAFLTRDLCGQSYLCYLVKNKNILNFLKMKKNKDDSCLIFGDELCISAKDACELTTLDMVAIIGLDGGVELYSGVVHVAKILISGVPSSVATSSYLSDSNAGPTFFKRSSLNAFPKRSSLLPQSVLSQSHQSPIFNDSLSQLSPVTSLESSCCDKLTPNIPVKTSLHVSSPREGNLVGLRDSVASRISLEFSTGILFRMELPNFGSSPLVKSCLNALRQVLPNELYLKLSIKWYCTRNVPGCHNVDSEEEWSMFSDVLLDLMGYDVELLKGTKLDIEKSPVIRAKKQKKCERSGDEDWNYLIDSKHHELCLDQTCNILGFGQMNVENEMHDFESFSGITETPNTSSRSSGGSRYDILDSSRTPIDKNKFHSNKFKSSFAKLQERSSLESIDETPLQPKTLGKSKLSSSRFKMCLDQGDISPVLPQETPQKSFEEDTCLNKKAPLYPFISWVLFSLHLLYEDMKLNDLKKRFLPTLVKVLHHLASDLKLFDYVHYYWMDFPNLCPFKKFSNGSFQVDCNLPSCFTSNPPNIFQHIYNMLLKKKVEPYPIVLKVNNRTRDLIQIIGLLSYGYESPGISMDTLLKNVNFNVNKTEKIVDKPKTPRSRSHRPIPHRVILLMIQMGITQDSMQTLPPGVSLILYEALYSCRDNPGFGWSKEAYKLAMRHDLASFCRQNSKEEVGPTNELIMPSSSNNCKNNSTIRMNVDLEEDGMEDLTNMDVLKLRFSTDQRVLEARRMLQSAQPVRITIQQRPDVTDHEFIQEQEKHLYAICLRTMALPVGRGMMTLRSSTPVITEKLPIPPLCLTGRVPPTDKVVDMSHIEVASNMNVWPLFHNGVAAGLRISPNAPDIDSQWIIYNKPKTNNEELIEHAGFLMALGLNGHLSNLQDTSIFHYLIKFHEMTSVGLLLGIAASKRGTMDPYTVRILSLHIEAMLPPTGIEIDVDVVVEPAALVSLGFLYQGTAHRHIAQVLLQEIGRPPGPEMANSIDRESYSLAAGLALGLVVFGRGAKLSGLGDMAIADTLHHYMVGGPKRPYLGSQREKYRTPSFLIWEGDLVNTHVTGPGAVLALGMLYFNTGNKAVAEWLKAPETQHLLEVVLPDALLLRTLAKGLILWDEIEPMESWVMSHVPEFIRPYCLVKPEANLDECIDYETMNQAYCNIVAGACMAIGLRFAGSAYEEAFKTLLIYAKMFTSLLGKNIGELCGRSTIETCLNVVTVSLAMVMAGTGDIEVLRLCRYLRSRVGPTNTVVTYGSHLATHMAIGLLFLGGGAYTLSTSPDAIAALLCAFYPKWPIHSNDNRYHLQALRHLYVLAVEPRLLLPRDIDTRTLCYAHITCVYLDVPLYKGKVVKLRAPCLLPELNLLKEVRIDDNRYWSIIFTRDKNWEEFINILSECSFVDVKQRAGCLSYLEDPQGFRSLLAQTLTSDDVIPWTIRVETIFGFSSDPILVNFTQYFLEVQESGNNKVEDKMVKWLTYVAYYCLTKDKLSLLPIWVSLLKAGQNVFYNASSIDVWQLKLMWTQALRSSGSNNSCSLIPPDMVLSTKQYFHKCFECWESDIGPLVQDYLKNNLDPGSKDQDKLTVYLTFHDIPRLNNLNLCQGRANIFQELSNRGLSAAAISKIASFLENYQYVLKKTQWMNPSSYIFGYLKGKGKNLSVKVPQEDSTKPPLRINIPKDPNRYDTYYKLYSKSSGSGKSFPSEPRSRSLIRTDTPIPSESPPKSESEIELSTYAEDSVGGFDNRKLTTEYAYQNKVQEVPKKVNVPTQQNVNYFTQDDYSEGLITALDNRDSNDNKLGENVQVLGPEPPNDPPDQKTLYIIIDVPEKSLEGLPSYAAESTITEDPKNLVLLPRNLNTLSTSPEEDVEVIKAVPERTRIPKIKAEWQRFQEPVKKKYKNSTKFTTLRPESTLDKAGSRMRFEVQEIEDAATYVFHLRLKPNLGEKVRAVQYVPEKEVSIRSMDSIENYPSLKSEEIGESITEFSKQRFSKNRHLRRSARNENIDILSHNRLSNSRNLNASTANIKNDIYSENQQIGDGVPSFTAEEELQHYHREQQPRHYPEEILGTSNTEESLLAKYSEHPDIYHSEGNRYDEAILSYTIPKESDDQRSVKASPLADIMDPKSSVIYKKEMATSNSVPEAHKDYESTKVPDQVKDEFSAIAKIPQEVSRPNPYLETDQGEEIEYPLARTKKSDSKIKKPEKSGRKDAKKKKADEKSIKNKKSDSNGNRKDPKKFDFQGASNVVKFGCESVHYYPLKFSAAFPPTLNEALKHKGHPLEFKRRESLLEEKLSNRFELEMTDGKIIPDPLEEVTESSIFSPSIVNKNKGDSLLGGKKHEILNVLKVESKDDSPKMGDNIINIANDSLTESKGKASVDSLTMMKKVKEIVDFDLNNAIKIFEGRETDKPTVSSVLTLEEGCWKVDNQELQNCIRKQLTHMNTENAFATFSNDEKNDLKEDGYTNQKFPKVDEESFPPKYLPSKKESDLPLKLNWNQIDSVVIYNPNNQKFIIDAEELKKAVLLRNKELSESENDEITKNLEGLLKRVSNAYLESSFFVDETNELKFETKSGDSILVYDELTQTWQVDYSILEKRKQLKEDEELMQRSEQILERFEKLEKENISTVLTPNSPEKRTFDYSKKEWKIYKPDNKPSDTFINHKFYKSTIPFKESNAEEIRKKNSDLYDNLFVINKEDPKMNKTEKTTGTNSTPKGTKTPQSNSKKEAKDSSSTSNDSGSTKEPEGPCENKNENKNPASDCEKKDKGPRFPNFDENENYWESYINMDIPPQKAKEVSKPKPKAKPVPPPPKKVEIPKLKLPEPSGKPIPYIPPAPSQPPSPPVPSAPTTPPPEKRRDESIFKILPSFKDKPIDEPRFKIPLPFGRERKKDSKKKTPPPQQKSSTDLGKKDQSPPKAPPPPQKDKVPDSKMSSTPTEIVKNEEVFVKVPPKTEKKPEDPKVKTPGAPGTPPSVEEPKTPPKKPTVSTSSASVEDKKASSPTKTEDPQKSPLAIGEPTKNEPKMASSNLGQLIREDPGGKPPMMIISPTLGSLEMKLTTTTTTLNSDIDPPPVGEIRNEDDVIINKTVPTDTKIVEEPKKSSSSLPGEKKDKNPTEHYVSENIVEISRNSVKEISPKVNINKIETVKLNITSDKPTPLKVTEINLNKKSEDDTKETGSGLKKPNLTPTNEVKKDNKKYKAENKTFYRNFEKYQTPFSDPDYEEKSIKINSDIKSNPNLKKLDGLSKTLVLHDVMKPSENIEGWLKDETDKMATLLLKVLQEAAEGKPKKKTGPQKSKSLEKCSRIGNPYDNIRKKQETTAEHFFFKVRSVNAASEIDKKLKSGVELKASKSEMSIKDIPVQSAKTVKPSKVVEAVKASTSTTKDFIVTTDQTKLSPTTTQSKSVLEESSSVLSGNILKSVDSSAVTEVLPLNRIAGEITEDIPGPEVLKKISNTWKLFPVIFTQATIFFLMKIIQLERVTSYFLNSSNADKMRKQTFSKMFTKYGPIVNLQGPISGNVILIHKPEHVAAVFEQDGGLTVRSIFDSLECSRRNVEEKLITSTISTDWSKPEWNDLRKVSDDSLMKSEKFLNCSELAAESLLNTIKRNRNGQDRVSEDFMYEVKRWSMEGLCNALFEKSFSLLENKSDNWLLEPDKLFNAVEGATNYLNKCETGFQMWRVITTPSLSGLSDCYRCISEILSKQLYQAELNLKNKNELLKEDPLLNLDLTFVESLLLNDGMTTEEVTCNLIDILLIGTNVMSSALGFVLYNLAQNIKSQNTLFKEIKQMLPEKNSRLEYNKINSLKFLQTCLKESLRINIPIPMFYRLLQSDILLSNYIVPKGTYVLMDSRISCMKEQIFEQPEKFMPERWMNDEDWMQNFHPFSSLPFCHGPRAELVKRVVEMQLCSCIAKIIRNYEIQYYFGEIKGTDSTISFPDQPLKLNFVPRSD